jgi:hypothetical protein
VGYICETDTFGWNRKIVEISEGDILAFKNAGAYCFAMSSNYNSRFRPAEVLIHKGKDFLIRKREDLDDLLRNQVIIETGFLKIKFRKLVDSGAKLWNLSVIIVNYNVKYFIEQCLHSVVKAVKNIDSEIFVVDNNSVDGSCEMIRSKFSQVNLIENKVNLGFSKANNQAIKKSKGKYILLLNPDTVVEEDSFRNA